MNNILYAKLPEIPDTNGLWIKLWFEPFEKNREFVKQLCEADLFQKAIFFDIFRYEPGNRREPDKEMTLDKFLSYMDKKSTTKLILSREELNPKAPYREGKSGVERMIRLAAFEVYTPHDTFERMLDFTSPYNLENLNKVGDIFIKVYNTDVFRHAAQYLHK